MFKPAQSTKNHWNNHEFGFKAHAENGSAGPAKKKGLKSRANRSLCDGKAGKLTQDQLKQGLLCDF